MGSTPERLRAGWLGRQGFRACLDRQLALREAILAGREPQTLLLVEHPPTVTLGRRASSADLRWSPERLAGAGIEVCETPRGGEATLHAPGQLVAYPVVHVGREIRRHIVRMAEVTIELFAEHGVTGLEFRLEHPGVWRGARKIASIGIHVSRGVTVQGLAMNVDVAPGLFASLVSCGMPEVEMISLAGVTTGAIPAMGELARSWAQRFAAASGLALDWDDAGAELGAARAG